MTDVHLINRLPSRSLGLQSPLKILEEKYPEVRLKTGLPVKIFSCVVYVHNPVHKNNKWSTKALKCVFLGYSSTKIGYKVYHSITRKYLASKDVVFDKNGILLSINSDELRELPYLTTSEKTVIQENEIQDDNGPIRTPQLQQQDIVPEGVNLEVAGENHEIIVPYPKYYERRRKKRLLELEVNQNSQEPILENAEVIADKGGSGWPIALRKGKRSSVKNLPYDITHYLNFQNLSSHYRAFILQIQNIPIPKTPQEAM